MDQVADRGNQTFAFRQKQDTHQTNQGHAFPHGNATAPLLIHEQIVGMDFPRENNRLSFAQVQFGAQALDLCEIGNLLAPQKLGQVRKNALQLNLHGFGDQHVPVKPLEQLTVPDSE